MTVGSLFSGIDGFACGFEEAGFKILWQVEIDEWCRKQLTRLFPNTDKYGDIREVKSIWLQPVDVICGGFPCQDISAAKADAKGLAGTRSGLWWEMHRIIRDLQPRWVVIENVAEITNRGLDTVLSALAKLGYDAQWQNIPCYAVGGPHRRERIWIVAYPNGLRLEAPFFEKREFMEAYQNPWKGFNSLTNPRLDAYGYSWPNVPPGLLLDDGLSYEMDWVKAFGNAVVPVIPELIARRILQIEHQQTRIAA